MSAGQDNDPFTTTTPSPRKKKAPPKLVELEEESLTPTKSLRKKSIQKPKYVLDAERSSTPSSQRSSPDSRSSSPEIVRSRSQAKTLPLSCSYSYTKLRNLPLCFRTVGSKRRLPSPNNIHDVGGTSEE